MGSTPAVGSSRTTTWECPMNATPTQIRRCMPSDNCRTGRSRTSTISIEISNLERTYIVFYAFGPTYLSVSSSILGSSQLQNWVGKIIKSATYTVATKMILNTYQGGYSQNFFSQILKIFVTLTWILEPIKHKNRYFITFIVDIINLYWYSLLKKHF